VFSRSDQAGCWYQPGPAQTSSSMSSRDDCVFPFSSLPEPVQNQIAKSFRKHLRHTEPNPLLAAGGCGRDAVLGSLTEIVYFGPKPGSTDADVPDRSTGPAARLLTEPAPRPLWSSGFICIPLQESSQNSSALGLHLVAGTECIIW
jgi:hypothetical protein